MIANCGPADYNYDETLSTLRLDSSPHFPLISITFDMILLYVRVDTPIEPKISKISLKSTKIPRLKQIFFFKKT